MIKNQKILQSNGSNRSLYLWDNVQGRGLSSLSTSNGNTWLLHDQRAFDSWFLSEAHDLENIKRI